MTQYSKTNYISTYNATFADNTSGNISEGDMRQFVQDTADSVGAGIFTTKVTISSAQILALNTTPITLVAAGGAGTVIEPITKFLFLDYNSAAYATNTNLRLIINGSVLDTAADVLTGAADTYRYLTAGLSSTTTNIVNQPLTIDVATGNPTAGNSPLYVYITYRIITL
jgi:hypothetical protein